LGKFPLGPADYGDWLAGVFDLAEKELEETQRIHVEDNGAVGDVFLGAEIEGACEGGVERGAALGFQQKLESVLAL
jgi:hypothetical protein